MPDVKTVALDDRRLIVPVAIREDVEARLQIPANLTEAEARKIAAVVMAYATGKAPGA